MVKIVDSASGKERTLSPGRFSMYVCGPTVYADPHIGNVRPLIVFDVLARLLRHEGFSVTYVHNITDVDDKIINRALGEKTDERAVAERYLAAYLSLVGQLDAANHSHLPKVTDHIEGIVAYVAALVDAGAAYVAGGTVYFRVKNAADYGAISGRKVADLAFGEDPDPLKESREDFALWKATKTGVSWDSPWGKGRPGWHTECAYFIARYADGQVDVHGGGADLKFPHHENENAQNVARFGKPIASSWMHTGHIDLNALKMSKSLGNTVAAKDVIAKYGARALRWLMYQSGYTKPIDYNARLMDECRRDVARVLNCVNLVAVRLASAGLRPSLSPEQSFLDVLGDDLDFPNAVTWVNERVNVLNRAARGKDLETLRGMLSGLLGALSLLGLWRDRWYDEAQLETIRAFRREADAGNFARSDELRRAIAVLE